MQDAVGDAIGNDAVLAAAVGRLVDEHEHRDLARASFGEYARDLDRALQRSDVVRRAGVDAALVSPDARRPADPVLRSRARATPGRDRAARHQGADRLARAPAQPPRASAPARPLDDRLPRRRPAGAL